MPWKTSLTWASVVGVGRPAAWWAWEMPLRRLYKVETLWVLARSLRYSATLLGAAGRHSRR
jgi:hypothetical protein